MDRKGKQKLKRYFIVYVIFAVFFTVGMYLITKYEENAKATQIALLLAEHPELEGEIVAIWEKSGTVDFIRDRDDQKIERVVQMLEETYGYHSGSGSSDVVIRIIWGIGLLVGVIVCSLFLYLDRRKNWSRYGDELGKDVQSGRLPKSEMHFIQKMVQDISYNNAKRYFGF